MLGYTRAISLPVAPPNDQTPTLSGSAEANSLISIFDGAQLLGTTTANGAGKWVWTTPSLGADGTHNLSITATDAAGNVSDLSLVWSELIDTSAPVFTTNPNTAVNENTATTSTPAGTVIYTASASDASNVTYAIAGGSDAGRFSIDPSTGQVKINFTPDYEAPIDAGGDNVYNYSISATDAAGNVTIQNASLNIMNVPEAPRISAPSGTSFWVMAGPSLVGAFKNHFTVGHITSDLPVS